MLRVYIIAVFFISLFFSCKKEVKDEKRAYKVEGQIQKGPFLNGSNVVLSELNSNLAQTGITLISQIQSSDGFFQVNATLQNPFVQLKCDGFYYNEVSNSVTTSPLTLYGIADLSQNTQLNVNVLTHLERKRVEKLVSQGLGFHQAKSLAMSEILNIFNINYPQLPEAQQLNIGKLGNEHAILLAISLLIQGNLTEADFSQFLADISDDISNDGILNNQDLGSKLISHAHILNLQEIRQNLTTKFNSLGYQGVPDFEQYIIQFKQNSTFTVLNKITYPDLGIFGTNVLGDTSNHFNPSPNYSFRAILEPAATLRVRFVQTGYTDLLMRDPYTNHWSYINIDDYNTDLIATKGNDNIFECFFHPTTPVTYGQYDTARVEIYENGASIPTRIKTVLIPY